MILLDHDWRITYLNAEARRLLAHEVTLLGRNLWELFPKSDRDEIRGRMEAALETGNATRFQFYGPDLENWFDLIAKPISSGLEIAFHAIGQRPGSAIDTSPERPRPDLAANGRNLSWLADELHHLAKQVTRVATVAVPYAKVLPKPLWGAEQLAQVAETIYRGRRLRKQFFPQLQFAEPQWDILLDLFVQTVEKVPISVTSACIAGDAPVTSGLRALSTLEEAGLVSRRNDTLDKRRVWVELTADGNRAISDYIKHTATS